MHKLPPIQYLPTFEAAARYCSFKLAAQELNITPSAISQQIKTLETQLGQCLFDRSQRQLNLTAAGTAFYDVAKATLDAYSTTFLSDYAPRSSAIENTQARQTLVVSMMPFIANNLVIPRLADFQQQHPQIKLIINTDMDQVDLIEGNIDAAIRFGIPPWQGLHGEKICDATSALVATEEYFAQHPIQTKDDWQNQTLIHCRTNKNDWQTLMKLMQHSFKPKAELHFDCYESGMQAAESGLGLAMAIFPITQQKVNAGKLKMMTTKTYPSEEGFYWVCREENPSQHSAVFNWITSVFND